MAVNSPMNADRRRLVYGVNVAVTIVLAVAVAGFVMWGASRYGGRVDLTSTGLNSVSPRTVQLLRGLSEDVTITGLYSTALKEIRPHAEKHMNRVADLLDLYETAGRGKVTATMIDANETPAKVTELLQRLREKPAYKDEAAPHIEALAAFPEVSSALVDLMQSELSQLQALEQTDTALGQIRTVSAIEHRYESLLQSTQDTGEDVKTLQAEDIPLYGRAVAVVKDYLEQTSPLLEEVRDWMAANGAATAGISDAAREFFAAAPGRFNPVLDQVGNLIKQTADLERVKLEELYDELKRGQTVLVETANEAMVLSQEEVWPYRTDRNAPEPPDGDPRDFAGEQAISSAILKLTQKERTAVVFVRFGGEPLFESAMPPQMNPMMQPPQAPMRAFGELLEKQNFITHDWDIQTDPQPPLIEDAARTIYVVLPPEKPQSANPMQPPTGPTITPVQKQMVTDAVAKSGMAIFLTRWSPPSSPYMPVPEKYEYADYLRDTWGVGVDDAHLALEFSPVPQKANLWLPSRTPQITSNGYNTTDHPIGKPVSGLPGALQMVAPLRIETGDEAPKDVKVEPIIETADSEDIWAITDVNRINEDLKRDQGTHRYPEDLPAPFPIAVAATRTDGEQTSRLVVFASSQFIYDAVVNASQLALAGGALRLVQMFPANSELFINSLHWLTGDADRIAVGPQRGDVPRLEGPKEGALKFTQAFLVGIWPGVALLAGAVVWVIRRR